MQLELRSQLGLAHGLATRRARLDRRSMPPRGARGHQTDRMTGLKSKADPERWGQVQEHAVEGPGRWPPIQTRSPYPRRTYKETPVTGKVDSIFRTVILFDSGQGINLAGNNSMRISSEVLLFQMPLCVARAVKWHVDISTLPPPCSRTQGPRGENFFLRVLGPFVVRTRRSCCRVMTGPLGPETTSFLWNAFLAFLINETTLSTSLLVH